MFNELPKAGDKVTAEYWNKIARSINRIWQTEAVYPITLTKGTTWKLALDHSFVKNLPTNSTPVILELPACENGSPITLYTIGYTVPAVA